MLWNVSSKARWSQEALLSQALEFRGHVTTGVTDSLLRIAPPHCWMGGSHW